MELAQKEPELGQYDVVVIGEAPDEKAAMRMGLSALGFVSTQTMVALS